MGVLGPGLWVFQDQAYGCSRAKATKARAIIRLGSTNMP